MEKRKRKLTYETIVFLVIIVVFGFLLKITIFQTQEEKELDDRMEIIDARINKLERTDN